MLVITAVAVVPVLTTTAAAVVVVVVLVVIPVLEVRAEQRPQALVVPPEPLGLRTEGRALPVVTLEQAETLPQSTAVVAVVRVTAGH
jgi:hypothetical protein